MKRTIDLFRHTPIPALPALLFLLIMSFSCRNPKATPPAYQDTDCMILEYADVETWGNKGFLSSADSLVFYTGNLGPGMGFSVVAYLSNKDSIFSRNRVPLVNGVNCKVSLPDSTILSKTQIKLSKLDLLDSSGKLKKIRYIKIIPSDTVIGAESYLRYDVIIADEGGTETSAGKADPCPPLCPVPIDDTTDDNEKDPGQ